jgi:hypothetical protein
MTYTFQVTVEAENYETAFIEVFNRLAEARDDGVIRWFTVNEIVTE